jgi:endoribonuclease LACTB2
MLITFDFKQDLQSCAKIVYVTIETSYLTNNNSFCLFSPAMAAHPFTEVNTGITRSFLLPCPDGFMLIDTGYSHNYNAFVKLLGKHSIKLQQIKYLLLTHHHHDHTGFASHLRKQSGCKLIAHQNARPYLSSGTISTNLKPLNSCIRRLLFLLGPLMPKAVFEPVDLQQDDIVMKGQAMDISNLLGYSGHIIHTPGHSTDSISLVLGNGHAFVGDVMMNLPLCGLKKRPFLIEDANAVQNSWKALKDAGAKWYHPAHGKGFA